ncbi:MAG: hypothetical protein WBA97_10405 [Actinophytocola sp.]|uniref:hypothetical protein n=1 Tax=Actinophytocola sp. TaxID=1872138 RepID=UPI003C748125
MERSHNARLRALLAESGLSGPEFIERVNRAGAEVGVDLRYQRPSVTQWLAGSRPRPPVPALVAEVFTRALGRHVTQEDTGMLPEGGHPGLTLGPLEWWRGQAGAVVAESSVERFPPLPYDTAVLAVPRWPVTLSLTGPAVTKVRRAGAGDVQAAESALELFSSAESALGGGHVRRAATAYLRSTLVPWLRAGASPSVRERLLVVAARMTYLCGFICFDDEEHGTAERYYLTALRLAVESGSGAEYGTALRAMSVQAVHLRHPHVAMDLADGALHAAGNRVSPRLKAFLLGQYAVAAATSDDRAGAFRALGAAERRLSRADTTPTPVAAYHWGAFAYQQAAVLASVGDQAGAVRALRKSVRSRSWEERRARAIVLARLVELHLAAGHLDQACVDGAEFLAVQDGLGSARALSARRALRAGLLPHGGYPPAKALLARLGSSWQRTPSARRDPQT